MRNDSPPDELRRLHHDERQSPRAIAERFDVAHENVSVLLASYGIPQLPRQRCPLDEDWIRREYVDHHRTLADIAAELGIGTSYLRRRAQEMGIPLRARGLPTPNNPHLTPEQLRQAQIMRSSGEYTVRQIAEHFGFTPRTVYRHLRNAAEHVSIRS